VTRTGSISRPLHQSQKIAHLASYTIPVDCLTDFEMCEVAPSEKPFWHSLSLRVAKREDDETLALDVPLFPWTGTEDFVWREALEAGHKTEAKVLETMLVLARLVQ
jgi:hypothetical protein